MKLKPKTRWGKILLITTVIWQAICIAWIYAFSAQRVMDFIWGFPSSLFWFIVLYAINIVLWGGILSYYYLIGEGVQHPE